MSSAFRRSPFTLKIGRRTFRNPKRGYKSHLRLEREISTRGLTYCVEDSTRIPQFNCMTCAGGGVSLEQRTHRPVILQSLFVTSFATVEDALIAPMPATKLRGTGVLRSLRKACALSCASLSTAESELKQAGCKPATVSASP